MIDLDTEERILQAFEVKKSPHGKGVLYITNLRVLLETQLYDIVLNLPFDIMRTYKNTDRNSFRIEWVEGDFRWHYELKTQRSAKEVFEVYTIANKEFSKNNSKVDTANQTSTKNTLQ